MTDTITSSPLTPPPFEPPSGKQFFAGLFNVTEYIKDHARLIRFCVVIGIWCLIVIGGLKVYRHFFPIKVSSIVAAPAAQPIISGTTGGTVNSDSSSNTKETKTNVSLIHLGGN